MRKSEALGHVVNIFKSYSLDDPGDLFEVADDLALFIEQSTGAAFKKGQKVALKSVGVDPENPVKIDGTVTDENAESDEDEDGDTDEDTDAS